MATTMGMQPRLCTLGVGHVGILYDTTHDICHVDVDQVAALITGGPLRCTFGEVSPANGMHGRG